MVTTRGEGQAAPGRLENVRILLNSWLIPNDTRIAEDRFDAYADEHHVAPSERAQLRRLREDLRSVVDRSAAADDVFNRWIERLDISPHVAAGTVGFRHGADRCAEVIVTCLTALSSGEWARLKACPDCQWVFYDQSRNASKRWCLMTAGGPDGRSCGSIAKVRTYRDRTRQRA